MSDRRAEFDLSGEQKFDLAVKHTLQFEGGFVDDPRDPGGATKFGVSLRFLRGAGHDLGDIDGDGDVDTDDIKALTRDQAIAIYKSKFWDRYGYGDLPTTIAARTFDMCVNMGPKQAHITLQRALRSCSYGVKVDGYMGPQTIGAADSYVALMRSAEPLMDAIRREQAKFYCDLVAEKPALKKYLDGWLRRARA
ncbi:glycoside hydrolase family 108 protein [Kordiimonas marina]|uniref:glycoside hydrolase family 108 protein n=1 Tax=Kordiimonas marina TaxID=2872312 RepID=UPI001FF1CDC3|nr:glycosyl hydrolase 108 family protein [Kordiimonas marina]MCJ9428562.1 hypothetical protein [Kordiimonas marina]